MKTRFCWATITRHSCFRFCGGVFLALVLAFPSTASAQDATYTLGTTNLLEGPAAGGDSVILVVSPQGATWTATANAAWLHVSASNQSGTGSTNVVFSYDANLGATRSGTLTIAGRTLTITQAGATYVAASTPMIAFYPGLCSSYLAVDTVGNIFVSDPDNNTIKKWTAANGSLTTLASFGPYFAGGVAVDGAGNVYIADSANNAIKKWSAADGTVTTLISSGLNQPRDLAVDGSGSLYIADNNHIKKWSAANGSLTTLLGSGFFGVAVDGAGNLYAGSSGCSIKKLPHAFIDPAARLEGAGSGADALPEVLPSTANLLPPFAPTSDQPWLTISGITNGVVSFSFTAATSNRTAHITLLGQAISITQQGPTCSLGTAALLEGPTAGSDSVVLAVSPTNGFWTAIANAAWLRLSTANRSGIGSTNVVFSYDANPGATRRSTIIIAGQTLTVTQAGSTYVPAPAPVTTLVSAGLDRPCGVAVDGANNVYVADTGNNAIKKWTATDGTVATLASLGLYYPGGVAVDGAGNVYIADSYNAAIRELPRAFVDPTARLEGPGAGSDALPVVLPATANLLAPFAPASDQPWLTISGITNGAVSFSFGATASTRTANITLLGQTISITQAGPVAPPALFSPATLANGQFQFAFSNDTPGASFTVLSTTNLALPLADWTVLGAATNSAPGLFQFTTPTSTNDPQRFYRVRSP